MSNLVLNDDTVECQDCYDDHGIENELLSSRQIMGTTTLPCRLCQPEVPETATISPEESDRLWRAFFEERTTA